MPSVESSSRPFAIVTGASSGIGLELARCAAAAGYDLLVAADERAIESVGSRLQTDGVRIDALQVDLATSDGVAQLYGATSGRPVDVLVANAGRGLGGAFLDQDFERVQHVVETNVTGTIELIHRIGRDMRERGAGRILVTGSIAGLMPGTYQAVYNGTKAFLDSFSYALRAELDGSGVSVTCLMPGATETEFFERADMMDTKVGTEKKQPPDEVAKAGWDALMRGEAEVVTGWSNKLRAAISHVIPSTTLARQHKKMAAPGTASKH
jgi:short-subunit dehydrogenase